MSTQRDPNLVIQPCTDTIASCGQCGKSNYRPVVGGTGKNAYVPLPDVHLFEVRVCSNGYQTTVTLCCRSCLADLAGAAGVIARGEMINVSCYCSPLRRDQGPSPVDTQETDADPEHNVTPTRRTK